MSYINNSRSERSLQAINECICPKTMICAETKDEVINYLENNLYMIETKVDKINFGYDVQEKVMNVLGSDEEDFNCGDEMADLLELRKNEIIEFVKSLKVKDFKENLDLDNSGEWHHTGSFFNETNHYDMVTIALGLYFKKLIQD